MTMAKYLVTNLNNWLDYGVVECANPAAAVARVCREAGYMGVEEEDGRLVWPDEETKRLCGDLGETWSVTEVGEPEPA
jgi:hypothetical protein